MVVTSACALQLWPFQAANCRHIALAGHLRYCCCPCAASGAAAVGAADRCGDHTHCSPGPAEHGALGSVQTLLTAPETSRVGKRWVCGLDSTQGQLLAGEQTMPCSCCHRGKMHHPLWQLPAAVGYKPKFSVTSLWRPFLTPLRARSRLGQDLKAAARTAAAKWGMHSAAQHMAVPVAVVVNAGNAAELALLLLSCQDHLQQHHSSILQGLQPWPEKPATSLLMAVTGHLMHALQHTGP